MAKRMSGKGKDPKNIALGLLSITEKKLEGIVADNSPLSIEDQVERQLKIATNLKLLGNTYCGWAAFY
jgi:phosphatidylinositol kinase/protein kinase (PI-3  family)